MKELFKTITANMLSGASDRPIQAIVRMGENVIPFAMVDVSRGTQRSRLQIEMAFDGSQHISGALSGVGDFSMQFMDCPLILNNKVSGVKDLGMLAHYLKQKTLEKRVIDVAVYSFGEVCNGDQKESHNDQVIARFNGIATGVVVTITPPDRGVTAFLKTQIDAHGKWMAAS